MDYPAISVAAPLNALGAKIGSGKAFAFGRSVKSGVTKLKDYYKKTAKNCPDTKWVLGGYSQGALVAAQAVESFNASKVVYMGLFGDPWTYLPEGKGALPKACFGFGLSSYRVYAPNCATHKGSLGGRNPYVPAGLTGKVGLWCNKEDYVCGGSRRLTKNAGHTQYVEKNELIWMANKVERKLAPLYGGDTSVLASVSDATDDVEDVIEAYFSAEEYNVSMEGYITFDASESYSFGHEIVEYLWSVNDGEYYSTGTTPYITRLVEFPNRAKVTVRIVDDIGRTAEATV